MSKSKSARSRRPPPSHGGGERPHPSHERSPAQPSGGAKPAKPAGRLTPHRRNLLIVLVVITLASVVWWSWRASASQLDEFTYEIVNTYPHDVTSFTQGLVWHDGFLYESTGRFGESRIRKVELRTGRPLINKDLDPKLFGEGLALVDGRLIQVTWQNRVGIVYDLELNEQSRFELDDDAWGLAFDGKRLILSDGTSRLQFLDPESFEVTGELEVMRDGRRMPDINELEFINGEIFANVWKDDSIYRIDPETGNVTGRINLGGLLPPAERRDRNESVLNGIAVNPETGNLLVTGKYWPKLFEIRIVPVNR
jgi:glutamine cyclotransferase